MTVQGQVSPASPGGLSTSAWKELSHYLPNRNPDSDEWWKLTGRQLAAIVQAAKYPIEKQYEALLFHYHWTVPYMGKAPQSDGGPAKGKSILALDGSPIEYSWKWNTSTNDPDVRYAVDPFGPWAGTELDPLNQQALREILHNLSGVLPGISNGWASHFLGALFDHDNKKYVEQAAASEKQHRGSTVHMAVELLKQGTVVKTYFFPRKLGQSGFLHIDQWIPALSQLHPDSPSRTALLDFLDKSPEGKHLSPFGLGVDNVSPEKARIKWYFHTPNTSFASMREVMTLGGRIDYPGLDALFDDLFALVKAVNGLSSDFPEDAEVPAGSALDSSTTNKFGEMTETLSGYLYYFDVAPGKELPEIKVYITTRYYGRDDLTLAHGITSWMEARGRGEYCKNYLNMMQSLGEHRRLDEDKGLQTFVSCLFKNGEIDVTTYLAAEAFHPSRLPKQRRGTLRRGD